MMATARKTRSKPFKKKREVNKHVAAAIIVATALVAGTYFLFTMPQQRTLAAARAQAAAAAEANTSALNQMRNADATVKPDVAALRTRAGDLDKKIPVMSDNVKLISDLPNQAKALGLKLDVFQPTEAAANSQQYQVTATGQTQAIMSFLGDITTRPATMTATEVTLTLGQSGTPTTATFTLTAYFDQSAPLPADVAHASQPGVVKPPVRAAGR